MSDEDDFRYISYPKFHLTNLLTFFSVAGQDGLRYWRDSQGYTNHLEKL